MFRKRSKMNLYHVMVRGIDKNVLFGGKSDKEKYLYYLKNALTDKKLKIYAICLMDNHAHMLIGVDSEPGDIKDLADFMCKANAAYARYYNKINDRIGPVFCGRYKTVPIFSGKQFLHTIRYIFHNPTKVGLSDNIYNYDWSSCGKNIFHEIPIAALPEFNLPIDYEKFINEKPDECVRYLEPRVSLSDEKAMSLIKENEGLASTLEIANMSEERQTEILRRAWKMWISIKMLARITGLSRRLIEKRLKIENII